MIHEKPHQALEISLAERVDYMMILASMAGADVVISSEESDRIRALCSELHLPESETAQVMAASQAATASVKRHVEGLRSSPLRFTLLSDCLGLAHADGTYGPEEQKEIHALARALGIDDAQVATLEHVASELRRAEGPPAHHDHLKEKLAAVGVPLGAMATASAVGLTAAGVSTGMASVALGLGIATGFGAALGLGAGTLLGVRWLKKKLAHEEE